MRKKILLGAVPVSMGVTRQAGAHVSGAQGVLNGPSDPCTTGTSSISWSGLKALYR